MATFKAVLSFQYDSALPRDEIKLTPHFTGTDALGLANALSNNLKNQPNIGATLPFSVKIYDAMQAPPSYPLATVTNPGTPPTSGHPREVALCLSYYSGYNRPTSRGRLYIPAHFLTGALAARPNPGQITEALNFKNVLTTVLPNNTHWSVFSKTLKTPYVVTDYWVDDEWDTVRSRGMKGVTRQKATIP